MPEHDPEEVRRAVGRCEGARKELRHDRPGGPRTAAVQEDDKGCGPGTDGFPGELVTTDDGLESAATHHDAAINASPAASCLDATSCATAAATATTPAATATTGSQVG